jgi:hypothetical protein
MVYGVRIPVTEESIAVVIGLSTTGVKWFNRKAHLPDAQKGFLMGNERVKTKG